MSTILRTPPLAGGRPPRWDSRRRPPAQASASLPPVEKVNLAHASTDLPAPGIARPVGMLHGQPVHLVRLKGTGPWCRHASGDALFFVTGGTLRVELRERTVDLEEGELLIVPRGVEHRPVADVEALVLMSAPSLEGEAAEQSPAP
ncbi:MULTISPECIES: cupin domain-containing protein [unclassified Corallococcus]|uniref:cupin domain-containing protein n=1 Tax=unclassified Corallococcus TaxID=2685029 RepID=UPI001A8DFA99|nr:MULTISPECIES: cupin domain-containing protein [unclassified Corallococcus]MBN9681352.1 cupin domain-containing protein [Corallococcus sp. NCSPR001]WAS87067.1 cupin domain-containing protein [Corallococcus sp. NCRR]